MKVSKVVLVVVALHVLVIGGIFVFEGCSRAKTPALADAESQPMATGDVATTLPTPIPVPAPVADNHLTAAVTPAVPAPAPAPVAPAPVATTATYAVKKGDSLYKIAKANKVTIEQLARANNLSKSSVLQIGQKLSIPAAAATPAPATALASAPVSAPAPVTALSPSGTSAYEVQLGDSLWKIAKTQGTTIAALKQANNLTSDSLKVGQKLAIPAKVAPATTAAAPATTPATTPASPATTTPPASGPAVIAPGITVR